MPANSSSRGSLTRLSAANANDGIVSTASLILGVAAASAKPGDILVAGVAGLVAEAKSMAAGEYVSVSSQSDTNAPILHANELSSTRMFLSSGRSLHKSTLAAAWTSNWRARSPIN